MTDVQRMIRTKTVKEVFVEKGYFILWEPVLGGTFCECFLKATDPARLCIECYGSGVLGGGYATNVKPIWFQGASFEEVENHEVLEDTTLEDSLVTTPMDGFVHLSFECGFQYHIYYGCLFELEGRYWKVIGVEEETDKEEDDCIPVPARWSVSARKIQEYEGTYAFLQNVKTKTPEDVIEPGGEK